MQPRHNTQTGDRMKQDGASLAGKRVAILVADGFEQSELAEPRNALRSAGAEALIVSPVKGQVKGWKDMNWGDSFPVDLPLEKASADDFDALLLPGGVINPDKLRSNDQAVQFVRKFFEQGKPVAAICHGPLTLINAGVVKGRQLTSYASIRFLAIFGGVGKRDRELVGNDA